MGLASTWWQAAHREPKRMGLDYVDIFYSHRPDPNTPLEETMGALDYIVRSGERSMLASQPTPRANTRSFTLLKNWDSCLIHQPRYNMFDRWIEDGLLDVLKDELAVCVLTALSGNSDQQVPV